MFDRIKPWLEPPHFEDADKDRMAKFLNTLGLYFFLLLVLAASLYVPIIAIHKTEDWILLAVLLLIYGISRVLLFRGQVRLSGTILVTVVWAIFQGLAIFSGGVTSPASVAIVATIVIIGLLFEPRVGYAIVLASILIELGLAVAQTTRYPLPKLLDFSFLGTWFSFALVLGFVYQTVVLVTRNLHAALSSARRESAARERAEAILGESGAHYKTLFENNHAAMLVIDPARGAIVDANPAACAFYGWSRAELVAMNIDQINTAAPDQVSGEMELALKSKRNHFVFKHRRADTSIRDVEIYSGPIVIAGKELLYSIVHDITERIQTEAELEETRNFLQQIVDTSPSMIFVKDGHGRFTFANQYIARYYGTTPARLVSKSAQDVHPFETQARDFVSDDVQVLRDRQTIVKDELNTAPDGGEHWFSTIKVPLCRTDGRVELLGISTDITVRKRAEQSLLQTEEKYRTLVDTLSEGIALNECIYDDQGRVIDYRILEVNPAFYSTADYRGEVVGNVATQLYGMTPEYVQDFIREHQPRITTLYSEYHSPLRKRDYMIATSPIVNDRFVTSFFDITERKRAEEALRESQARYQMIFENSGSANSIFDTECRLVLENKMAQNLGPQRQEHTGKSTLEIFGDQGAAVTERMRRVMAAGMPEVFETEFDRQSGKRWIRSTYQPIFDEEHKLAGVQVISQDITERKKAERSLQESEERFRTLIEQAPVGISLSRSGQGLYANPKLAQLIGLDHAVDFEGSRVSEYFSPQERAVSEERSQRRIAGLPAPTEFESQVIRKDGSPFQAQISVTPVKLLDGPANLAFVTDISERARAEQALRESEAKYRLHFQNVADVIYSLDQEFRPTTISPSVEKILGYGPAELMGRRFLEPGVLAPESVEAARADALKILAGERVKGEYTFIAKNGARVLGEITSVPLLDLNGHRSGVIAVARDITERKQHENELNAIATLSAALRAAASRAEMLPIIVEQISRLLTCESVSAEIIDPMTRESRVEAAFGAWTALIGYRQPPRTGLNEIILETRRPYRNNHLQDGSTIRGLDFAMENVVACAGAPLIARDEIIGFLWIGHSREITEIQVRLLTAVSDIAANAIHRATLHEQTQKDSAELALAYDTTLEGWAHALELRDQETEGHTRRVVQMTLDLARAMGVSAEELENVRRGALLHDIGKMGIPDSVLLKPGTLNDREWEIMRRHPEYARKLLEPIEYLRPAADIPSCHHEKWDGTGYPRGLSGEAIPLVARIFALVDVWDALRADRPYRKAWETDHARKYILEQSGKHFDPRIVPVFLAMVDP